MNSLIRRTPMLLQQTRAMSGIPVNEVASVLKLKVADESQAEKLDTKMKAMVKVSDPYSTAPPPPPARTPHTQQVPGTVCGRGGDEVGLGARWGQSTPPRQYLSGCLFVTLCLSGP